MKFVHKNAFMYNGVGGGKLVISSFPLRLRVASGQTVAVFFPKVQSLWQVVSASDVMPTERWLNV